MESIMWIVLSLDFRKLSNTYHILNGILSSDGVCACAQFFNIFRRIQSDKTKINIAKMIYSKKRLWNIVHYGEFKTSTIFEIHEISIKNEEKEEKKKIIEFCMHPNIEHKQC